MSSALLTGIRVRGRRSGLRECSSQPAGSRRLRTAIRSEVPQVRIRGIRAGDFGLRVPGLLMTYQYEDFTIEPFEAGRGLWHARIRRSDMSPVIINGVSFPSLEVGFAWSDVEMAVADAKSHIDRFRKRWG
ncbi:MULTISPECIES: hypothetical protein [unclassified Bradyrhizobium]|uniref:hypothetical protein n=1 Tax=unclassified Bradyrhizobium TaxID=2631580 RepID=UPI0028F00965|nr:MULTISPECIES: hypothetical protein [unclassified Bradyrhizobium]